MEWECHQCGRLHDQLPEACRSCGARPEIVRNVWRCAHCGQEGIPSSDSRCPGCGAERGLGVETAVDTEHQLEGELARQLAAGKWLYCAFCDTQVPPVDSAGNPHKECPTCKGPLAEATRQAAEEELSLDEARRYRQEQTAAVEQAAGQAAGQAAAPQLAGPPVAGKRRRRLWIVAPLLLGGGLALWLSLRGPEAYQVAGRSWRRVIQVEAIGPVQEEAWAEKVPAGASDRSCRPAVHHYNKVPDGTERTSERVPSGRTCASYSYKKKGGVSVKKCARWEKTYKTVQRSRTRYRKVPVMAQKCRYTINRWHRVRELTAIGGGDTPPSWPSTAALSSGERSGARRGRYILSLVDGKGQRCDYSCKDEQEWQRYPLQARVLAETSLGGTIEAISPAP